MKHPEVHREEASKLPGISGKGGDRSGLNKEDGFPQAEMAGRTSPGEGTECRQEGCPESDRTVGSAQRTQVFQHFNSQVF